jgi:hypothetical protein
LEELDKFAGSQIVPESTFDAKKYTINSDDIFEIIANKYGVGAWAVQRESAIA